MIHARDFFYLRLLIVNFRKRIETGDESIDDKLFAHELADAAEDLTLAIRDRIGGPAEAYDNASKGGP